MCSTAPTAPSTMDNHDEEPEQPWPYTLPHHPAHVMPMPTLPLPPCYAPLLSHAHQHGHSWLWVFIGMHCDVVKGCRYKQTSKVCLFIWRPLGGANKPQEFVPAYERAWVRTNSPPRPGGHATMDANASELQRYERAMTHMNAKAWWGVSERKVIWNERGYECIGPSPTWRTL